MLRRKTEQLQLACDGRFTAARAQMCRLHLGAYDHLTAQIATLDQLVAAAAAPFAALIARLITIPGIGRRTAEVIVAETGGDMARFATAARLAAWAGLAPGDIQEPGNKTAISPLPRRVAGLSGVVAHPAGPPGVIRRARVSGRPPWEPAPKPPDMSYAPRHHQRQVEG